ncbi:hypothetical protein E6C60_2879 [Paenibacillus algicola]|uniref:N-acetyltransferase domain-containing protein n=1 Tax=Paenibacillus algicola TaxID=2565926 RepID=A0A4P8XP94_9BACL|nr:GNAT family N-acetyltransferase [Paenibacillus algicola]QCT03590.1 hypothetical protein E6C60_2879 [Paenibacillus algicola]
MELISLVPHRKADWPSIRRHCCQFMLRYAGQRTWTKEIRVLEQLKYEELQEPGTSLLGVTVRGEEGLTVVGVLFTARCGEQAVLLAVHPLYRRRRLGTALLQAQQKLHGRITCHVPLLHAAALRLCFQAGMTAIGMTRDAETSRSCLLFRWPEVPLAPGKEPQSTQVGDWLCLSPS